MTTTTQPARGRSRQVSQTPLAALGEIRTCLLPHSTTLDIQATEELLALIPGANVVSRDRPGPLAFSPPRAVGVDCHLSRGGTATARIVGTVASTAILVGGRISQVSSHVTVVRAPQKLRRSWSHYVSRVGTVEIIGTLPDREGADQQLTDAYRAMPTSDSADMAFLDIASVCARQLDELRYSPLLDQSPPLLAPTTRLRWTARVGKEKATSVYFEYHRDDQPRTLTVTVQRAEDLPTARRFCEDVAAHDWLLTVINAKVLAANGFGGGYARQVEVLAPVLEHLAHLWMPGAHVPDEIRSLWRKLQTDPGFSRQWDTRVAQLEHRIAVATYHAARGGYPADDH
ncbi:SCO2521 family protein [Nocardia sp. NPDC058058]|uniref:SCO2521 family protein n=1 Tax=Nocardia sp. NPDC058058 TaxID=3346317 RepID=UPI0036D8A572